MNQPQIRVRRSQPSRDGAGVAIQRLHGFQSNDMDPFLMLDEIRSESREEFSGGFPPHPHRGMETLTYMKVGGFEHQDHLGHRGSIRAGGAQWMSAGRGIIHSEMPLPEHNEIHGFQLWINLPADQKMKTPEYRNIEAEALGQLTGPHWQARLIAGQWSLDQQQGQGPLQGLPGQAAVADLILEPEANVALTVTAAERVLVYVYQGNLNLGHHLDRGWLATISGGTAISLAPGPDGAGVLVLKGIPLQEPVAHYGPFVMNTEAQIQQAIADYQQGRFV